MKAILLLLTLAITAQGKIVTLFIPPAENQLTNEVAIAAGDIAEIISYNVAQGSTYFIKDGSQMLVPYFPEPNNSGRLATPVRNVIVGPATVRLAGRGPAYVTVQIDPPSFPPDKTIVIPQGGGASIAMECSTNLIDWVPASLGVYTKQPAAKFFRLTAERVQ
jgi:hypothetical protein